MIKEKQDQNISVIKMNIDQILINCSFLKPDNYGNPLFKRSLRVKTQPSAKLNLEKSLDFDTCVNNINTKVRCLQSAKLESLTMFQQREKKKIAMSENCIQNSQYSPLKSPQKYQAKMNAAKSFHFPILMAKYQKAYSPRNASSSQKYSPFQKQKSQNKNNQSQDAKKYESYHTMVGEKKRKQELSYMFVMSRVVKENIVREKKALQQRKKKRRIDNLKMKEIVLFKCSLPNL